MKTSLVIASVLFAGVALEVAAFTTVNQRFDQEWSKQTVYQYGKNAYDNSDENIGSQTGGGAGLQSQQRSDKNVMSASSGPSLSESFEFGYTGGVARYPQNEEYNNYYSADLSAQQQQQYKDQNREAGYLAGTSASSSSSALGGGLAKKIVEKIATVQQIALNHKIGTGAGNTELDAALAIAQKAIKLPGDEHVRFYNGTVKQMNNGNLEFMSIIPQKDTVFVKYQFGKLIADGSFSSNVRNANRGYYTVALKDVYSNVTAGFYNYRHTPAAAAAAGQSKPAQYRSVEATIITEDGTETQAFDEALENSYLNVLQLAVSNEVLESTNRGMIGQMKTELGQPMVLHAYGAGAGNKLYDMKWKEDNVAVEMYVAGIQYPLEQQLSSAMEFQRKLDNTYRMRYRFTLNNLQWTSALKVLSSGKMMSTNDTIFQIKQVDILVSVYYNQQQHLQRSTCGKVNTKVQVRGLQYIFEESTDAELVAAVENKLQRFIEHSLGLYILESLKREICQY